MGMGWLRKILLPGGGNGNPLQYSCLKKSHGPRNLDSYSLWGSQRVRHNWVTKNASIMTKKTQYLINTLTHEWIRILEYYQGKGIIFPLAMGQLIRKTKPSIINIYRNVSLKCLYWKHMHKYNILFWKM